VPKLIIFDDLMSEMKTGVVADICVRGSHHKSLSAMMLHQNIFPNVKDARDANLNTKYRIIFANPADTEQIANLSRRVFGKGCGGILTETLEELKAQKGPSGYYAYLLLDLHPKTPNYLRLRTNIFPGEETIVYEVSAKPV
jgi:hypothetical protein